MDTNLGSRGVVWATIGAELITVCYELRYMVFLAIVLIIADLWWGYFDSKKRYYEACNAGDSFKMEKYKWHKSRAGRRSANKACDYLTYLLIGAFLGLGVMEPMGICGHVFSAAVAIGLGCICEIASITGHVLYVKMGVEIKLSDAWRWMLRFFVNLIKIKSHDIGEAVEDTMTGYNNKLGIENEIKE